MRQVAQAALDRRDAELQLQADAATARSNDFLTHRAEKVGPACLHDPWSVCASDLYGAGERRASDLYGKKGGVRGAAAAACRGSNREKDTFDHNERDNTSCIGRISPYVELRLREREPSTAQEQLRGEISLLTDKIGQFELERAAFAVRENALGAVLHPRVPCVLPSVAATAALCSRAVAGR